MTHKSIKLKQDKHLSYSRSWLKKNYMPSRGTPRSSLASRRSEQNQRNLTHSRVDTPVYIYQGTTHTHKKVRYKKPSRNPQRLLGLPACNTCYSVPSCSAKRVSSASLTKAPRPGKGSPVARSPVNAPRRHLSIQQKIGRFGAAAESVP